MYFFVLLLTDFFYFFFRTFQIFFLAVWQFLEEMHLYYFYSDQLLQTYQQCYMKQIYCFSKIIEMFDDNSHKKQELEENEVKQLIHKIMDMKDNRSMQLLEKFSLRALIGMLDQSKIETIQKIYKLKEEGLNLLEFARFFINFIRHEEDQALHLTIGLIDLFRDVVSSQNIGDNLIKFVDLTNYLCSVILQKRDSEQQIETKYIPEQKRVKAVFEQKEYLLKPAVISGNKNQVIYKLAQNKTIIDKSKHDSLINQSYYSFSQKQVFCLESLSESIAIYDPSNCALVRKIKPNSSKLKKDSVVLSFAYSQKESRIGAVLKDFSLSFWDYSDDYEFQKCIATTASHSQELQIKIWYLEYFQEWITSDKVGHITVWNLMTEKPDRSFNCKMHTKINDLCEIPCLNLIAIVQESKNRKNSVAVGTHRDNAESIESSKIILYNFLKGEVVAEIDTRLEKRTLHTILYSETYQVLLSAGYEKKINIFQINNQYLDSHLKGQLLGHQSIITSFALVNRSPMVVSADDKGKVKVWNIKNYKCMQTIDFSDKIVISKVLDMVEIAKIGILGSRISFLEFDSKEEILKKYQKEDTNQAISIQCNYEQNELLILTKHDIRVYSLKEGRLKNVYCEYHQEHDEITQFKYLQISNKYVIGNQKGQLCFYCAKTAKLEGKYESNGSEVCFVEFDQHHKLMTTCSEDGSIYISKRNEGGWQNMRQMKNNLQGKYMTGMAVSVYHNLIAIGVNQQDSIYIWDYEYAKIICQIQLPTQQSATYLHFINGYSLLLVGTSTGRVHALSLQWQDYLLKVNYLWTTQPSSTHSHSPKQTNNPKHNQLAVTQIIAHVHYQNHTQYDQIHQTKQHVHSCKIYVAKQSGFLEIYDLTQHLQTLKLIPTRNHQQSYNPERQFRQNFMMQIKKKKYTSFCLDREEVKVLDGQIGKQILAHKGAITNIYLLEYDEKYLISAGEDGRIKIWSESTLICDTNINLPLPYLWNLSIDDTEKVRQKIVYAFKLISIIFQKFGKDITVAESKNFKMESFFRKILKHNSENFITQPQNQSHFDKSKELAKKHSPILFQNQYTTMDLHYQQIKKYNAKQISGVSLKQMEMKKKIQNLHKEWLASKRKEEDQRKNLLVHIQYRAQKNQQKDCIANILKQKKPFCQKQQNQKHVQEGGYIKKLNQKIQKFINFKDQKFEGVKSSTQSLGKGRQFYVSRFCSTGNDKKSGQNRNQLRSFENYYKGRESFNEKIEKATKTPQQNGFRQSVIASPRIQMSSTSCEFYEQSVNRQTGNNFRHILKDMSHKIEHSKKNHKLRLKKQIFHNPIEQINKLDFQKQNQNSSEQSTVQRCKFPKYTNKFEKAVIKQMQENINKYSFDFQH